jgi:molybdenum cofactor cytidylyltransferase
VTPLIVLPAAGASSRMKGRDKLLETIEGQPLLRRQTLAALATGCPVAVTLPPDAPERHAALNSLSIQIELVPDADQGMSGSLRQAVALLAPDQPLGILLPDVPGIGSTDISAVLAAFRAQGSDSPARGASRSGTPGTPIFLPHRLALQFATLTGDEGGSALLAGEAMHLVRFHDDRATRDLDTPEDWAEWRAETGHAD